jgi:hypothetical protein
VWFTRRSPTVNAVTADRIVMPRRRSMSPVSVWGGARLDAAEPVDRARVIQQALGQAGLTRIDMRENANVADPHG